MSNSVSELKQLTPLQKYQELLSRRTDLYRKIDGLNQETGRLGKELDDLYNQWDDTHEQVMSVEIEIQEFENEQKTT